MNITTLVSLCDRLVNMHEKFLETPYELDTLVPYNSSLSNNGWTEEDSIVYNELITEIKKQVHS